MRSNSSAEILSDSCISLCPFRLVVGNSRWREDQGLNDIPAYFCQFQKSRKVSDNRPVLHQSSDAKPLFMAAFAVALSLVCFLLWKIRGRNGPAKRARVARPGGQMMHEHCGRIARAGAPARELPDD